MKLTIRSILKWLLVGLVTLFLGVTIALFLFKDRIIDQVLAELERNLKVPFEVSSVELDYFHRFPNVAVAFYDVVISSDTEPTLKAEKFYILLNPVDIAKGNFIIDRLEIVGAGIRILVDENNKSNIAEIFASVQDQSPREQLDDEGATDSFSIRSILLKNIDLRYQSIFTGSSHNWHIHRATGAFSFDGENYLTIFKGKVTNDKIVTRTWQSRRPRDIDLDINLNYSRSTKQLDVIKSDIGLKAANFMLNGNFRFIDRPTVNLSFTGDKISFRYLAGYLPPVFEKKLMEYKSDGSIKFEATISGEISPTKLPGLYAKLELKNVDLTDKSKKANISKLNVLADLEFKDIGDLSSGSLNITSAKGLLEKHSFNFKARIRNFTKPKYSGNYSGNISTEWLLGYLNFPYSDSGQGLMSVNLKVDGEVDPKEEFDNFNLEGSIGFKEISFQWADSVSIDRINGLLQFSGDKVSLHDLKIEWLQSDVLVNGHINAIQLSIGNPETHFLLQSDIKSENIAIEDIVSLVQLAPAFSDTTATSENYYLDLELNGQFKHLSFRKYHGRDISAVITLENQFLEIVDLHGKGMGGEMKLNGTLNILPNQDVFISARTLTRAVNIDSLFYVFGNFQQSFITDKDLKGQLYADVSASMYFDSTGFRRNLLTVESKLRIIDGELNNFKPIMALAEYINDKDDNLDSLKFSDLENRITIRNDTVFIPEMSIHTNVRNIAMGGYHTLDQHINYRLAVPIVNERVEKDEAFGAVQKSSKGSPNLLFRVKGTTTDYKVTYDLLRATGNVLKLLDITKIFKKKEGIPVDSTFLEDEEFDWDN